jgi:ribosome maturation factor RimP
MSEVEDIERLIEPSLEAMGFGLVRVRYFSGKQPRLQIMAEGADGSAINIDDCTALSRTISALLDVEDSLPGPYVLEVSSPGIDRPLVRIGDFERFAGFEARVETVRPIGGRKRFRGTLLGVSGRNIRISLEGAATELPFEDIGTAKLVMTEALLEASLKRREM